jgi:hypothetical protein
MVRDQGPRITLGLGLFQDDSKSFQKGRAILIVPEDFSAFDPPGHYVLQDTGSIKSWLAWHRFCLLDRIYWILQDILFFIFITFRLPAIASRSGEAGGDESDEE